MDNNPESVTENEDYKLLCDFSIWPDHKIEARRPDLEVIKKNDKNCQITDLAIIRT